LRLFRPPRDFIRRFILPILTVVVLIFGRPGRAASVASARFPNLPIFTVSRNLLIFAPKNRRFDLNRAFLERKFEKSAKKRKNFGKRAKSVFTQARNIGIIRRFDFSRREVEATFEASGDRSERAFSAKIAPIY